METALKEFKSQNGIQKHLQCFSIIWKLLLNIHKNPNEPKYKCVKKTNPTIKTEILDNPGGVNLLLACGFANNDMTYIFHHEDFLPQYIETIEYEKEIAQIQTLPPEEREKKLLILTEQHILKMQKEKAELEKKIMVEKMKHDSEETGPPKLKFIVPQPRK